MQLLKACRRQREDACGKMPEAETGGKESKVCQAVCPHKHNSKTMLPRPGREGWLACITQTNNIFHTAQLCRSPPCLPSKQPTGSPAKTMLLAGLKPGSAGTGLRWWCQVSPTRADLVSFIPTCAA